jgi:peptidoglycan/LPS O-acetylase OafA/YrhL
LGILRLWLACAVVVSHCGGLALGYHFLGGDLAVRLFYVVSGFYMALILDTKYVKGYWLFIFNRFARLYPVYLVLLVLAMCLYFSPFFLRPQFHGPGATWLETWNLLTPWTRLALVMANLVLEGKDLLVFLKIDLSTWSLAFDSAAVSDVHGSHRFLFLPQAWSLGVEMHFYLMAPFVTRLSNTKLGLLLLFSLILKLALIALGLTFDPWVYRFFPAVLSHFLLGVIAYRLYLKIVAVDWVRRGSIGAMLVLTVLITLNDNLRAFSSNERADLTIVAAALAIPWLFHKSRQSSWDRSLGALSYPVYLCHLMVVDTWVASGGRLNGLSTLGILVVTVALSWLLVRFVELPSERWRYRLNAKHGL